MTGGNNNSSGGEGEDARKKRGNSQDEREACKKVRSEKKTEAGGVNQSDAIETIGKPSQLENINLQTKEPVRLKVDTSPTNRSSEKTLPQKRVWDLESAILYLVQIGTAGNKESVGDTSIEILKNVDKPTEATSSGKDTNHSDRGETSLVVREYLSHEENYWITFRAAHAGDASTIAQWYRKQRSDSRRRKRKSKHRDSHKESKKYESSTRTTAEESDEREGDEAELEKRPLRPSSSNEEEVLRQNNSNDSTVDGEDAEEETVSSTMQLEHWLAEGLGDENTCPFVHGLMAYVHRSPQHENGENDKSKDAKKADATVASLPTPTIKSDNKYGSRLDDENHYMAAVVLMSLSWAHGKRNLKIEWMSIDSSFLGRDEGIALRQKVWLRIHTLSSMTNCQAISIDEELLVPESIDEKQEQGENEQHGEGEEEPLDGTLNKTASTRKPTFVEPSAE